MTSGPYVNIYTHTSSPVDKVLHTHTPSIWEVKARESGIQGYPLHSSRFEDSLGYIRYYHKKRKERKEGKKEEGRRRTWKIAIKILFERRKLPNIVAM